GRRRWIGRLNVDVPMLTLICVIVAIGFVVLYSAMGESLGGVLRQAVRFALGLGAFFVLAQVPPRYLRMWAPWLYCFVLALLDADMIEAEITKRGPRWIDLGVVRLQPSELL